MKILSLIIPAYNSGSFLDKCISSMLEPQILDKLEIIVVNDGSTDNSVSAVQKYCALYPDTVRLVSQENKGHGGALNTGCSVAQGKYIKAIDADDWVESQNLSAFISALEEISSDVVLTHFNTIDISTNEVRKWRSYPSEFGKPLSLDDILTSWRDFYRCLTFHGITYNTDFYRKHGIQLSEHVFYEDYEYVTFPCCYAKSVTPLDLFIYDYRIGDVNQSVSDISRLNRIGHLEIVLNRMISENRLAAAIPKGGQDYIAMKAHELLLSYFTTTLLVDPNKKQGRKSAKKMMHIFKNQFPEAAMLAYKKYFVFRIMNYLSISKKTWESFLRSRLYNTLRRNHDFS